MAGYIAKYATKAAECVGTLDRRIRPTDDPADLHVSGHARRLITECLRLGAIEEFAGLRLAEWAHMLGFRGHFSTKSRRYSVTLGRLRADRIEHNRREHDEITTGRLPFEDDQVIVIAHWRYLGQGMTPGEALLTAALTGKPLPTLDPSSSALGSTTVDEAAERLRVSRWTLYNLIRSNQLRTVKIGRRRLVPVNALIEYIDQLMEEVA